LGNEVRELLFIITFKVANTGPISSGPSEDEMKLLCRKKV